jgi:hypothetical protein
MDDAMADADNDKTRKPRRSIDRSQVGPYFILGLDKDASPQQIEAHWARRVVSARKNQIPPSLADVNWAREALSDLARRIHADVSTLNRDTHQAALRAVGTAWGCLEAQAPSWTPLPGEEPPIDYLPDWDIPDPSELRRTIVLPSVPQPGPIVLALLQQWLDQPLDVWNISLPEATPPPGA